MKRRTSLFLKAMLILVGIGALAFLIWEPQVEGRNANATLFEIYFKDAFLAYAYVGSTPFFVGLYHAFRALGRAGTGAECSRSVLRSVRTIRYCAIALIGFVAVGEIFIMLNDSDDRAGGVFMGALITFASIVVAAAMLVLERTMRNAVDTKQGNDVAA